MRVFLVAILALCGAVPGQQPNILWITCEDISPHLGCYGDKTAVTPNIDALARQGTLYRNAFATIGVCAPARSTLISGMYPNSIGSQHMRCQGRLPEGARAFPEYLREAGYYCTNNSKKDYNLQLGRKIWDESSRKAHWRKRKAGQPFFSIFNFTSCHESQIRQPEAKYQKRIATLKKFQVHDPKAMNVPPYHPDTDAVRKDWARYADMITFMDTEVGRLLRQLDKDGLAENTIVFFYSDHGAGMPRSKRWLFDSGLRVPMVVRVPEKFKKFAPGIAGLETSRLVSFVDFAPTVLQLAGVPVPEHMQGQAFLGGNSQKSEAHRRYVFGFRDRMDERYDMIRCVSNGRFKYIRNFMPHLPYAQYIDYMYQMPTMKDWQKRFDAGGLSAVQRAFFEAKPTVELYDTQADPHEVVNLAGRADHAETQTELEAALKTWMTQIVDVGFLPESDLRTRFGSVTPFDGVRDGQHSYPLQELMAAADLANSRDERCLDQLGALLSHSDAAMRYWGATGMLALGPKCGPMAAKLRGLLRDPAPDVQVAAATALCGLPDSEGEDRSAALQVLVSSLTHQSPWVQLRAANALDHMDAQAKSATKDLEAMRTSDNKYVQRVVQKALRDLRAR
jgi:arylsulfatase A-like enzyme